MKLKLLSAVIGILFLVMISCSKENDSATSNNLAQTEMERKAEAIQHIKNPDAQRVAFNMLTSEEKSFVWNKHLTDYIKRHRLTNEQLAHIKYLIPLNTARLYADKKYATIMQATEFNPWIKRATRLFDDNTIYNIAFNLYDANAVMADPVAKLVDPTYDEGGGLGDCVCNVGSAFTCAKTKMIRTPKEDGTVVYQTVTTFGNCSKNPKVDCKTVNQGCGFMQNYPCDGNKCDNTDTTS